jgi:hypothetical protein
MSCRYLPWLRLSGPLSAPGGAQVSVFLYVAIIGIWLFVLVPRWLKRSHEAPAADSEWAGHQAEADDDDGDELPDETGEAGEAGEAAAAAAAAENGQHHVRTPVRRTGPPPARRSRVLQARRRLLTMLVLLTAVAAACVGLKLTSWWVCVPPGIMLGAYLLLLREASLADAEQARRRADTRQRVEAGRQRAHEIRLAEEERYSAQIIDISARIGDQLYDQYADATVRAVGD